MRSEWPGSDPQGTLSRGHPDLGPRSCAFSTSFIRAVLGSGTPRPPPCTVPGNLGPAAWTCPCPLQPAVRFPWQKTLRSHLGEAPRPVVTAGPGLSAGQRCGQPHSTPLPAPCFIFSSAVSSRWNSRLVGRQALAPGLALEWTAGCRGRREERLPGGTYWGSSGAPSRPRTRLVSPLSGSCGVRPWGCRELPHPLERRARLC